MKVRDCSFLDFVLSTPPLAPTQHKEGELLIEEPFLHFYCAHQQLVWLTLGEPHTNIFKTKSNGSYTSIQCILGHILFLVVSPFNLQEFLKNSSRNYFSGLFFENIFLVKEYRQIHAMMHFLMQNIFQQKWLKIQYVVKICVSPFQKKVLSCIAQNMVLQIFGSLLSRSRQSVSKHLNRTINQNSLSALVARQKYTNIP